MTDIKINGSYHNYSNVRLNVFGRTVTGLLGIEYGYEETIEPVLVVGSRRPVGYTQGNTSYSGKITLLSSEVDAIQALLPSERTLSDLLPFPVSVSYVDDTGLQVSHLLKDCKFKGNKRTVSSGSNDALSVEIELYIGSIDWNA